MNVSAMPDPTSLPTTAARTLTTTSKTRPQMQGISPRWLLDVLPWIDVDGGTYRLTRTTRRAIARRGSDQPAVVTSAGHTGEFTIPSMYIEYDDFPAREYPMAVAQTVIRLHTRVDDLYNKPMNQFDQQVRLTIEALRERQEFDLLHHRDFGLLNNAVGRHRIKTFSGSPTPADLDNLISKQRRARYLLAHPRAIAAFGRECNKRGIFPGQSTLDGRSVRNWRGIPILPCDKLAVSNAGVTQIVALRPGDDRQGVIGLRPIGLPDEYEPGVSLRRLHTDHNAITSYLVSVYYSIAMMLPNSVCVLDNVDVDS